MKYFESGGGPVLFCLLVSSLILGALFVGCTKKEEPVIKAEPVSDTVVKNSGGFNIYFVCWKGMTFAMTPPGGLIQVRDMNDKPKECFL